MENPTLVSASKCDELVIEKQSFDGQTKIWAISKVQQDPPIPNTSIGEQGQDDNKEEVVLFNK